jgi:protein-S-isoprenylcysteine O-methyltransferase Ste14
LGLIFAWWARIHLGRLWSARITRKEGHKVIDTGPYAFVRHPIYTGLIFAALATAAERGSALAVLGAVLFCAGYWMKARLEERFLRQELGADAYDRYATRTAMLVPFLF